MKPQLLALIALGFFAISCSSNPEDKAAKENVVSPPKDTNLVVLNRFKDPEGNRKKIIGIYIIPSSQQFLRDNPGIQWKENLIKKALDPDAFIALYVDTQKTELHDIRIDLDGTDSKGKPLQYFHSAARLYSKGTNVHVAITSSRDNTCPWTISTKILSDFAKP